MCILEKKTVLITGASSGIGEACAHSFAREGARLILVARREKRLASLSQKLEKYFSIDTIHVPLDVREKVDVESTLGRLPDSWKIVDVLVNNAGLSRGLRVLSEGSIEDWEEMIDTNIKGLLYVTRHLLPAMVKRNSGHIINIGSIAGHEVYPRGNVYCATKWAVNALGKSLRVDLFGTKVRVTSIDPGMVDTEFSTVRFRGDGERAAGVYANTIPLTSEDVAEAVVFAASRPEHVNISEMIVMPTYQATCTMVHREQDGDPV